jgi:hypothetical protein
MGLFHPKFYFQKRQPKKVPKLKIRSPKQTTGPTTRFSFLTGLLLLGSVFGKVVEMKRKSQ